MQDQNIINEEERHEAATEEPTTVGISAEAEGRAAEQPLGQCPSLVPGAIPPGADGTEPSVEMLKKTQSEQQREEARRKRKIHWTVYPTKVDVCAMGKTQQNGKVYEVRISKRGDSKVQDTYGQCKVNGKTVLTCSFTGSAWMLKRILTEGMQALVNYKAKRNRDSRRAAKRRAANQELINKELA